MRITKSEIDSLKRHEANAVAYEAALREIVKTMRALEPELNGPDPVKAAWAEGWIACGVVLAKALKGEPVKPLYDDGFPF